MAKRLTEEMVIARTKISDLGKIKRLNCWGSELVDVSLLRRMPCVEVLSLSINQINSLEDFQWCKRLEELYIRQNDIRNLNQVCYLQLLPNLKNLWLGENPCANEDGYRLAVLRALPQLQKLDNIAVTSEELKEAQRKGRHLSHPDDVISGDDVYTDRYGDYAQNEQEYSPQGSPNRPEQEYETEEADEFYSKEELRTDDPPPSHISDEVQRRQEAAKRNYSPEQEYTERRRCSYERESPPQQQYYDRSPPSNNINEDYIHVENYREIRLVSSQSSNSVKEYTNGERHPQQVNTFRQNEPNEVANYQQYDVAQQRRERYPCSASYRPPFTRRPVTRNSNILSAVLCLVKELDYPSLEVVEMAVRCRMDELDE